MRKEVCHLVIMEDERPRRVNGLSPPYTGSQLSTWILLPVLVLQFLFFSTPLLPLEASIPCTLCFIALAGFSTYFAYVAMNIDPADPALNRTIQTQRADGRPMRQRSNAGFVTSKLERNPCTASIAINASTISIIIACVRFSFFIFQRLYLLCGFSLACSGIIANVHDRAQHLRWQSQLQILF